MDLENKMAGPVIIGGVGGSGTRVVAEVLRTFGFYLGADLNSADDNLTYTLLFKRPGWYRKNYRNRKLMKQGLDILGKSMVLGGRLTIIERIFLATAVRQMSKYGHNHYGEGKGDWPQARKQHIIKPQVPDLSQFSGWGWKEPNSHLLLPVYEDYYSEFKYIHTIRHGLDMAFSGNQQQLFNWAPLFGVELPGVPEEIPHASFRYWVEANRRVMDLGQELGPERFLAVNFDELCREPRQGILRIAGFLGTTPSHDQLGRAIGLPVAPVTTGRYKNHSLDGFLAADLEFLKDLGYSI